MHPKDIKTDRDEAMYWKSCHDLRVLECHELERRCAVYSGRMVALLEELEMTKLELQAALAKKP
jgi:hypothetical protein